MAKNKKKNSKASNKQEKEKAPLVTLEAIEAADSSSDEMPPEDEWNDEARALHNAIKNGSFDHLIQMVERKESDDESIEEVELDSDYEESEDQEGDEESSISPEEDEEQDSEKDDDEENIDGTEEEESDEESEEEEQIAEKMVQHGTDVDLVVTAEDDESEQDDSEENIDDENEQEEDNEESDEDKPRKLEKRNIVNAKALQITVEELHVARRGMPWAETFDIIPSTPLPFGPNNLDGNPLDIHDDLKREVAFYDLALEAVHEARKRCEDVKIPFTRPDDFFAEMVKSDDHMARIKDRLIFENKKIEAVAQRKSNKEQKLRAKEAQTNKIAEKAKRKREHMQAVESWAQSSAAKRGRPLDDNDDSMLQAMSGKKAVFNKKRVVADRKYGFGGKRGRFKQNDPKDMNDTKGFNPRGNFSGGMKKTANSKTGAGANRKGKRARDASRTRKS